MYAAWRASLSAEVGQRPRILAWAPADGGFAIASLGLLSLARPDWTHRGWHEIERGGWDAESATLAWDSHLASEWPDLEPPESSIVTNVPPAGVTAAGRSDSVILTTPGRLPEVFRERVAASIAVQRFVPLRGERGVIVTARRDLTDGGAVHWHTRLTKGLGWRTPGVREAVAEVLAEVRSEYDLR